MLHEIDELTKDGEGYVYWKGTHVEHFSYRHSEQNEEGEATRKLVERCRQLEKWNFPVNSQTALWNWTWFENWESLTQPEQNLYRLFFEKGFDWHENAEGNLAFVINDDYAKAICEVVIWQKDKGEFIKQPAQYKKSQVCWHAIEELGFKTADMQQNENGQKLGTVYATTAGVVSFIKRHNLDDQFFSAFEKFISTNL